MSERPFQAGKLAIKVFIDNQPELQAEITYLIQTEFPNLSSADINLQLSQNKNYLSLTYQIVTTEEDAEKINLLYRKLSKHPKVKMVL